MRSRNKILIILAVFIFALLVCTLLISNTKSFATDESTTVESLTVTLYDGSEFVITNQEILSFKNILVISGSEYSKYRIDVYASNDGAFAFSESDGSDSWIKCVDENLNVVPFTNFYSNRCSSISAAKTAINSSSLVNVWTSGCGSAECYYLQNITYSSYDILTRNSDGTVTSDVLLASTTGNGSFFTPVVPDTPTIVKPQFVTTIEELQTGKIDSLVIKANDFNNYEKITLSIAEINRPITDDTEIIYHNNIKNYDLYSIATFNDFTHFVVDSSKLSYGFENGKEYVIYITSGAVFSNSYGYVESNDEILDILYFTVGGLTEEEILQEKQDITNGLLEEQQEILKEQNETSKGIWGTIKEILSYLNPFSENFFAYKLVELILDGLKSLFIPEDGFFETFFTNMKDWFSERLGFLFYPFELIIDILNKILNVNFSEPIFNIPDINEPFTDIKLIGATTYNLNSLLSNSVLENIHNIYLVVVDSIIVFALVNLAKRKFEEVTSK